jgi:hypothetical protein
MYYLRETRQHHRTPIACKRGSIKQTRRPESKHILTRLDLPNVCTEIVEYIKIFSDRDRVDLLPGRPMIINTLDVVC